MQLCDFLAQMEVIAPQALAMDFDNPGLLIGPEKQEIRKVLVALDCSMATAQEAVDWGADLLLTHHPVFFGGVKAIRPDLPATAAPWLLLRHGVGLFAAHTNLDTAQGGVNDCLAKTLGLGEVSPLPPENMGRVGSIQPCSLHSFAGLVQKRLEATLRVCGDWERPIRRVALLGGAGGDAVYAAKEAGADVLVTGEIKHHQALEAQVLGIAVVEAGHYETERVVLEPLMNRLQEAGNDVQYKLTRLETPCLRGI